MSGYRFLSLAEEEMSEASVFYDAASSGLGNDFLDDVQQAIDKLLSILRLERRLLLV